MKTLLLNSDYQPLAFISDKRAIRFILKDKVDIISIWKDVSYVYASGFIDFPAVLRLKNKITRNFIRYTFSKGAIFKRDNFVCQYCYKAMTSSEVTIDHIIPKSLGGKSTFENCVSSCKICNSKKGSKLLSEIGMKLIREPITPEGYLVVSPIAEGWHNSWELFIGS